jgi:hypothetical protein
VKLADEIEERMDAAGAVKSPDPGQNQEQCPSFREIGLSSPPAAVMA